MGTQYNLVGSAFSDLNLELLERSGQKSDMSQGSHERIKRILDALDVSVPRPTVYVAGSNGKGTTLRMLQGLMESAGHEVFSFTSPAVVSSAEQYHRTGYRINDETIRTVAEQVLQQFPDEPITSFELEFVAASIMASTAGSDYFLLEAGLGGSSDATAIVPRDTIIVTSISLEHTEFFGSTIMEVAAAEFGVISCGASCILGPTLPAVADLFVDVCHREGAEALVFGRDWNYASDGTSVLVELGADSVRFGAQLSNRKDLSRSTAIACAAAMKLGVEVSARSIDGTRSSFFLPGRGEFVGTTEYGTKVYFDGAHNSEALEWLAADLAFSGVDYVIFFAMLLSKDLAGSLEQVSRFAKKLVVIEEPGDGYYTYERIFAAASELGLPVIRSTQFDREAASSSEIWVLGSLRLRSFAVELCNP